MKFRVLSLAALLIVGVFSTTSALRIQSQAVSSLQISQLSYSETSPFDVQGKIWGTAPAGEVTRVLYRLVDSHGSTSWEFTEPFSRTYLGNESLDLSFQFDFSDMLVDSNSKLFVELQRATMNGVFSQTLAQGAMDLVFPEAAIRETTISRIDGFRVTTDEHAIISQVRFRNFSVERKHFVKIQLFDATGKEILNKNSSKMMVAADSEYEFSVLVDLPDNPGKFRVRSQVFADEIPVTGVRESFVMVEGDFAILSNLEVSPDEFLYTGDTITINYSGINSRWGESVDVQLYVQDEGRDEVFQVGKKLPTDEIGRFTDEVSFVLNNEVEKLIIVVELTRGVKSLGKYEFSTTAHRKLRATEGQSELSFAFDQATQDFELSNPKAKMGMVIGVAILLLLVGGFIWMIRHMRKSSILVLLLAFSVAGADAAGVNSFFPEQGWIVNPMATEANFQKLQFSGSVDLGMGGIFPVNIPISAIAKFGNDYSVSTTFETLSPSLYKFVVEAPAALPDGVYPLEIELTWAGIPFDDSKLEIELLRGNEPLAIVSDTTSPVATFQYFDSTDEPLEEGSFTKDPVVIQVECDDETGCLPGFNETFSVVGNFCSIGDFCETNAINNFVICDQVGNCSDPAQAEINQYDPVSPVLASLDLEREGVSAKTQVKAFESYIFSLFDLEDPTEDATIVVDATACDSVDSPYFSDGTVCREKSVRCAFSPIERGIIDQTGTATVCEKACPSGTESTPWGTCQAAGCSYTHFPFCFNWVLNGTCNTFPFCFNMMLQ